MKRFIKSFDFALQGLRVGWKEQPNFRFHSMACLIAVSLGFLFQLSATEWLVVVIVSGGVFAAELFNTAVEKAIDLVSPTYHPLAKQAKDLSAAGVLAVAATAALCGILIYGKHFLRILIHYL